MECLPAPSAMSERFREFKGLWFITNAICGFGVIGMIMSLAWRIRSPEIAVRAVVSTSGGVGGQ